MTDAALHSGWDKAWQAQATPWDRAALNPALAELIETKIAHVEGIDWNKLVSEDGKALVAGCGRVRCDGFQSTTVSIGRSWTSVERYRKLTIDSRWSSN